MSNDDPLTPAALAGLPWHALPAAAACAALGTGPDGLDEPEALRRAARFGPNRLRRARRRGPLRALPRPVPQPADLRPARRGLVTAPLGEWVDTGVILGVVVINAVIGFLQEGRAEQALDAIRGLLGAEAAVVRDGRRSDSCRRRNWCRATSCSCRRATGAGRPAPARGQGPAHPGGGADRRVGAGREGDRAGRRRRRRSATAARWPTPARWSPAGQAAGVVVAATGEATEIGRIGVCSPRSQTLETPLPAPDRGFARQLTARHPRLAGADLRVRPAGPGLRRGRHAPRRGRPCGGCDPRGPAGDHDHHAGDRACSAWPGATRSSAACPRSRRWAR